MKKKGQVKFLLNSNVDVFYKTINTKARCHVIKSENRPSYIRHSNQGHLTIQRGGGGGVHTYLFGVEKPSTQGQH